MNTSSQQPLQFFAYRKVAPTLARELTQADYEALEGRVQTREALQPFEVGDFLAKDAIGQWPIHRKEIIEDYEQITEPDAEGFAEYRATQIRFACQMMTAFTVKGLAGLEGDYWVKEGTKEWVTEREQFGSGYTSVLRFPHACRALALALGIEGLEQERKIDLFLYFWVDQHDEMNGNFNAIVDFQHAIRESALGHILIKGEER